MPEGRPGAGTVRGRSSRAAPARRPQLGVASVSRTMRVLQAFAEHSQGVSVTRLSAQLGYGKASLSKILGTLEREGFVRQDARTGLFQLSWRLLALAFGHAHRVGISAICMPILQGLADETDELVQLALIEGGRLLFVAKAEGQGQHFRMLPLVGLAAPIHATAGGKVWLSSLPRAEAAAQLARLGLPRYGPRTITSRARLLAQLPEVRRRGYALVDEELVAGGRAVAAPMVDRSRVIGVVTVSGPTFRLSIARLHRLAPRVKRAAAQLVAMWPLHVGARDFGVGLSTDGNGRGPRAFEGAPEATAVRGAR
jgi:IclR family transcriptional regulator, acetate operon repressor